MVFVNAINRILVWMESTKKKKKTVTNSVLSFMDCNQSFLHFSVLNIILFLAPKGSIEGSAFCVCSNACVDTEVFVLKEAVR